MPSLSSTWLTYFGFYLELADLVLLIPPLSDAVGLLMIHRDHRFLFTTTGNAIVMGSRSNSPSKAHHAEDGAVSHELALSLLHSFRP